jgi:hypothetical protein
LGARAPLFFGAGTTDRYGLGACRFQILLNALRCVAIRIFAVLLEAAAAISESRCNGQSEPEPWIKNGQHLRQGHLRRR